MADAKPAVYFVPLMIFPCLLVLVTMLLLCCSAAMEAMDRLYTAFCLFVSCWLATFIVIPMKNARFTFVLLAYGTDTVLHC